MGPHFFQEKKTDLHGSCSVFHSRDLEIELRSGIIEQYQARSSVQTSARYIESCDLYSRFYPANILSDVS